MTDEDFRQIAREWTHDETGGEYPHMGAVHRDSDHDHMHLLIARDKFSREELQERKELSEELVRDLERLRGIERDTERDTGREREPEKDRGEGREAMHALNVTYDVEDRAVWKKIPLSILYTVLLAVLLIAVAALMLIGPQLASWIAQQVGLGSVFATVWSWARIPVAVVLLVLVAALVYYLFPNTDQPFRVVTPGAVLAVIVWVVASLGFSWYVANFASYNATYGALAAVIVLLFYFFISAAILLFGAELNSEVYRQATEGADEGEKRTGEGA